MDINISHPSATQADTSTPIKQTCSNNPEAYTFISPEEIVPYPKAEARKSTKRGRKAGKARILIDTPEKEELLLQKNKKVRPLKQQRGKIQRVVRKVMESDSDGDEISSKISFGESDEESLLIDIENEMADIEDQKRFEAENMQVGDFVLVQFKKKGPPEHYIGEICEMHANINLSDLKIKFFKRINESNKFWYESDTIFDVPLRDVELKLPNPKKCRGSKRLEEQFIFEVNFSHSKYNVK